MPVSGLVLLGSAVSETVSGFGRSGGEVMPATGCLSQYSLVVLLPLMASFQLSPSDQKSFSGKSQASFKKYTHGHGTNHENIETPAGITPVALGPGQEKCWGKKKGQ